MGQSFVGEIQIFAGNFAPRDWHFCDGSLLAISEYDTLFSLIGTTYGGDGQTTFAVPDLRGRIPIHQGGGFVIGQSGGAEVVTLTTQQLPVHSHAMTAANVGGDQPSPAGNVLANSFSITPYINDAPGAAMAAAIAPAGAASRTTTCSRTSASTTSSVCLASTRHPAKESIPCPIHSWLKFAYLASISPPRAGRSAMGN